MYKIKHPKTHTKKKQSKVIWLSDLHLPDNSTIMLPSLLTSLQETPADAVIITGDISSARSVCDHLRAIAQSCPERPVYFVTGNHDYYGSSFAEVDSNLKALCSKVSNLHYLNGDEIIRINANTCLIGHPGWADARAGYGLRTYVKSPDHQAIRDFSGLSHDQSLKKMQTLGKKSANAIRKILPLALAKHENVLVITHVAPFTQGVKRCHRKTLPHFTNLSAGLAIWGISQYFPTKKITVFAGHTHRASTTQITPNIDMHVAGSLLGTPKLKTLTF